MKELFLVYKTDVHHSYASRDLIGVCTSFLNARMICGEQARKEGYRIDSDQSELLHAIKQTQGYEGEGEYVIESVAKNTLF